MLPVLAPALEWKCGWMEVYRVLPLKSVCATPVKENEVLKPAGAVAGTLFDKTATKYEHWEILSSPSLYLKIEPYVFAYVFAYCFSSRHDV